MNVPDIIFAALTHGIANRPDSITARICTFKTQNGEFGPRLAQEEISLIKTEYLEFLLHVYVYSRFALGHF